jgi:predicted nucleotidyltransferase
MKRNLQDPFLVRLTEELIKKHKCHTVILYGSRARGDETEFSDYDLMGIRKAGKKYRVAEKKDGHYIDIFIYPEKDLKKIGEEHLYMEGAVVLFEKEKSGIKFANELKKAVKKKYKPLPTDEIQARRVWLHKMFDRANQRDIEGNYRRIWLQEALLCEYFNIRKIRYCGCKKSFTWLKKNDPKAYQLFDQALSNPSDMNLLKKLVEKVSNFKME